PTLGEQLQASGKRMLVASAGSTGSSFLNNHKVAGGAILHAEYALPESLHAEMVKTLGPPPAEALPANALDRYIVDAVLKVGLPKIDPSVTVLWLTDPDTTAHPRGIGSPVTTEALKHLDGEIKRIQDGLAAAELLEAYDIWVTSDHGFATHTGAANLNAL